MLPTIMNRAPIDPWTRTPRSIAPFSASAPSHHSLSSADFITNIAESDFWYTQVPATAFNGASESTEVTRDGAKLAFYNRRAEVWWRFREALDPDQEGGSAIA